MSLFFLLPTILLLGTEVWTGHSPITGNAHNTPMTYQDLFKIPESASAVVDCKTRTTGTYVAYASGSCRRGLLYNLAVQANGRTVTKLRVCFDTNLHRSYWSQHVLEPSTQNCSIIKAQWVDIGFTGLDVDSLYGSVSSYADRGQLTPSCDFTDEDDRKATYFYLNSVPVYIDFLHGNWKELEVAVRYLVNASNLKAKVTTGTIGVQCLVGGLLNYSLSYPEQLFKIVAFEDGSAQLFIGVNSDSDEFDDVCDAVPGFGWPDVTKGRIYECEITDELLETLGVESDAATYDGSKL